MRYKRYVRKGARRYFYSKKYGKQRRKRWKRRLGRLDRYYSRYNKGKDRYRYYKSRVKTRFSKKQADYYHNQNMIIMLGLVIFGLYKVKQDI